MRLSERLERLDARSGEAPVCRPLVLDVSSKEDRRSLERLLATGAVRAVHDTLREQIADLLEARDPPGREGSRDPGAVDRHLEGVDPIEYGRWVFYPWSGRLVHLLGPEAFRELRSDRNRYKITEAERAVLASKCVGIAGLSVGHASAVTMAMEGVGGELRLADFDRLGLHNLNRLRAGVHDLGTNKTVLAVRAISEIDPYLRVVEYPEGVTRENIGEFLDGLDLLVEVCDDLYMKVRLREMARQRGIPVVMDTSDRGLVDVERFDREPDRPLFHGLAGTLKADDLVGLSTAEKVPWALGIIGAGTISDRAAASLVEIEETISSWPQLASDVTLGAAVSTDVARRILLGQMRESGRFWVDVRQIVRDGASAALAGPPPLDPETCPEARVPARPGTTAATRAGTSEAEIVTIVEHGILAPSGGNCQPWRFLWKDGVLSLVHDIERSRSYLDFEHVASHLSFGAVLENIRLAAAGLGTGVDLNLFPEPDDPALVATMRFGARTPVDRDDDLLPAVADRVTSRRLGRREPLARAHLDALVVEAGCLGARLQLVTDEEALSEAGAILGRGDRLRFVSKIMHGEMMDEMRWTREEVESTRDGIDVATLEMSRADLAAMRVVSSWPAMQALGRFGGGRALEKPARNAMAASSALGLVTMDGDDPESWIRGGRAMQRVWLRATRLGLSFQPMAAIIGLFRRLGRGSQGMDDALSRDVASLWDRFRGLFDVDHSMAQPMLFRLGVAGPPTARSLRRRIEDVLTME